MESIYNFYSYNENLAAGGQPNKAQIESLHKNGFKTILNISPASTPNYVADEPVIAESLGINYIHYPVDCSNLKPIHSVMFNAILNNTEGKTFVHCGGNIKSSALLHIWNVTENKMTEEESLETLLNIQNPEQKWFDYFKAVGLKGLKPEMA